MIYLSGATNRYVEDELLAAGVGLMVQPGNSYHRQIDRFPWWAADNGCFSDAWDEETHLAWLDRLPRADCLFAVAPDVYPDAAATLERSRPFLPLLRAMGFPVALVAQDGAENLDLPWDDFDCLFVGGERLPDRPADEWKLSPAAAGLVAAARRRGKWTHMGRVNGKARIAYARSIGCLSADGTSVKYARTPRQRDGGELPDPLPSEWVLWLADHPTLFGPGETPALPIHRSAYEVSRAGT